MKSYLPDSHGFFSLGLFLLTAAVLGLLVWQPDLASNALFATLAQTIVITGLINMAASFYFGASKAQQKPSDQAAPTDGGGQ